MPRVITHGPGRHPTVCQQRGSSEPTRWTLPLFVRTAHLTARACTHSQGRCMWQCGLGSWRHTEAVERQSQVQPGCLEPVVPSTTYQCTQHRGVRACGLQHQSNTTTLTPSCHLCPSSLLRVRFKNPTVPTQQELFHLTHELQHPHHSTTSLRPPHPSDRLVPGPCPLSQTSARVWDSN